MALRRDPADRAFLRYCRHGEPADLGRVFDLTAPELLRVALYLCGNRTDAEDVLQKTFLSAIEGCRRFDPRLRVLPWLCGIAVNHARAVQRDRLRRRELGVPPPTPAEPIDVVADRELAARVGTLRAELGSPYREVLDLHLEHGLNARQVAERLGRPAGTVRTQLVRAYEILRRRLPSGAMAGLPVVPDIASLASVRSAAIAAAQAAGSVPATVAGGGTLGFGATATWSILVSKKILLSVCALVIIAGLTLRETWPAAMPDTDLTAPPEVAAAPARTPPAEPVTLASQESARAPVPAEPPAESAPGRRGGPGHGSLRVTTRWQHDRSPAPEIGLTARISPLAFFARRDAVSDASGVAVFAELAPGPWQLTSPFAGKAAEVDVVAGRETRVELAVRRTCEVRGRVVDADERPVPDARIWLSQVSDFREGFEVTRTDAAGRFRVSVSLGHLLGARKDGHAPSYVRSIDAGDAGAEIVLTLRSAGGSVRGTVRDPRGAPVAWARVLAGNPYATLVPNDSPRVRLSVPAGCQLVTDQDGVFVARGVAAGPLELQIWAEGFAPWRQLTQVYAGRATELYVTLPDGATVEGTVRDAQGAAVAAADIVFGGEHDWVRAVASSGPDGRFRLASLPAGPVELTASRGEAAAVAELELRAGAVTAWDPVIGRGQTITGTVLGPDGAPFAKASVRAHVPDRTLPQPAAETGADGRFELAGVGGKPLELQILAGNVLLRRVPAVRPGTRDLIVRLAAADLPTSRIRGRIVDVTGRPVAASVVVIRVAQRGGATISTDSSGRFAYGPTPAGVYELMAHTTAFGSIAIGTVTLAGGEDRVLEDVVVRPPGTVEVTVLDAAGRPVQQCYLSVYTLAGHLVTHAGVRDGKGRTDALQPGRYLLFAGFMSESAVAEVIAPAGGTTSVTLHGEADVRVRVRVRGGDQDLEARVIATSPDGRFTGVAQVGPPRNELRLPPGRHHLDYRAGDGRRGAADVEIKALGEPVEVELELSER